MSEVNSNLVLAQWREQEAKIRVRSSGTGVASMEQWRHLSGLQFFEKMLAGELPQPNMGATLNFLAVHAQHGMAVFQGKPLEAVLNPLGTVHGGWYGTLLDSAVGCAIHSVLPAGRGYTTLEFKINIVRGLPLTVPLVRAVGEVVHAGRQIATAQGRLVGPDGTLYAHASTTCLVFDLPPAKP